MLRTILSILLLGLALPVIAEDHAEWRFGGDAYLAGRTVTVSEPVTGDLFLAGDKLAVETEVPGSAHIAGRYISLEARVGQNFYGAGMEIDLDAPIAGSVTIAGDSLSVGEPVSGNLRATGSRVDLQAPVAGSAFLAGENVEIDAAIGGDLALAAANVDWGDGALVTGEVHIYSDDPDAIVVPESVADAARVSFHEAGDYDGAGMPGAERPSFFARLRGWLGGIVVVGVLGTIFAAVAPQALSGLRERALARPVRAGLAGFVGLSALIGSVVLLAMTGLGILLIPVSLLLAVLLGLLGYVVGTYAVGVWALGIAGRGAPATTADRAIAAFAGAAIGALVGLVPWLGWLAVMAIFLVGAGALVLRLTRRWAGASAAA